MTGGNKNTPLLMFAASMFIFGTVGIFRKFMPFSSGMIAFCRGITGALFLCIFVKIRRRRIFQDIGAKKLLWLIISGAAIGFNWILLFEAYEYTSVSVATLCYYMQPTIVILLSPLLLKEKLAARKIVCAAVSVAGMVLVSGILDGTAASYGDGKGIILGLSAAALYAVVILTNKKVSDVEPFEKTIIQLFSAAAVMIPYLIITEDFAAIRTDLGSVFLLLTVGLLHTGIAYTMYFGSMERLSAQTIAIFSYIDPVTALILSAVILGETLSAAGIIGAVMILGAAILSEVKLPRSFSGSK